MYMYDTNACTWCAFSKQGTVNTSTESANQPTCPRLALEQVRRLPMTTSRDRAVLQCHTPNLPTKIIPTKMA